MKLTKVTSILSLTAGLVLFTACKKDETTPTVTTPVTYTPEQNKANLQTTGQNAMKAMDDAKTLPSLDNTANFVNIMNAKSPFDEKKTNGIMPIKVMYALDAFHKNGNQTQLFNTLRELKTLDSNSVEFAFNEIAGIYDWNGADSTWKKSTSTDLVFNFPGTKSSTTNDCQYAVTYKGYTGTSLLPGNGNTPEKVVAKLTVKGDVLIQFNFDGAYDAVTGVPTSLEVNLNFKPYNMNTKLTASSTDVAYSYAFTHNSDNILAVGASLKGEFTKAHLESLQDSSAIKGVEDLKKIATKVNFYFQVMNVKLDANADVATLSDDVKNLGGENKMNMTQASAELNKNISIKVFYTDKNVNIAHAEFYQYLNTNNQDDMNVRLVFDDASKTDVETYFKTGFEGLQKDFESFQEAMKAKFN